MNRYENFECHTLDDDGNLFFCGELPEQLRVDDNGFEMLWRLHPQQYHIIKIHGRLVATPRWQQAFGADYYYTGRTNRACPCPRSACRSSLGAGTSFTTSSMACCSTGMTGNSNITSGRITTTRRAWSRVRRS